MKKSSDRPFVIAIDGFSSCGKSTLAKQIAKELNFIFIDSGAMYRAVTLYFLENKVDFKKNIEVDIALNNIHISFQNINGTNATFLNGINVENKIRSLLVSGVVSEVSTISAVRKKMVKQQRQMKDIRGIVMDGRDIGTVVFPHADLKLFITADSIVRAQRRYYELLSKNQITDLHEVISNIQHRDYIDTTRDESPLRQADDAILLDNTHFTVDQQFNYVMELINSKIK